MILMVPFQLSIFCDPAPSCIFSSLLFKKNSGRAAQKVDYSLIHW